MGLRVLFLVIQRNFLLLSQGQCAEKYTNKIIVDSNLVDCVKQKAIRSNLIKKFGPRFIQSKTKRSGAPSSWTNNPNNGYFSNWNITNPKNCSDITLNNANIPVNNKTYPTNPYSKKYKFKFWNRGGHIDIKANVKTKYPIICTSVYKFLRTYKRELIFLILVISTILVARRAQYFVLDSGSCIF